MELDQQQQVPSGVAEQVEQLTGCSERERFIVELEFMQCLSNPHYLTFLAQNKYLEDPAFRNYLHYLRYWKRPEYAKFLQYPHCLYFLEQLQDSEFCKNIARQNVADFIHTQQFRFWQHYWTKRLAEAEASATPPPLAGSG